MKFKKSLIILALLCLPFSAMATSNIICQNPLLRGDSLDSKLFLVREKLSFDRDLLNLVFKTLSAPSVNENLKNFLVDAISDSTIGFEFMNEPSVTEGLYHPTPGGNSSALILLKKNPPEKMFQYLVHELAHHQFKGFYIGNEKLIKRVFQGKEVDSLWSQLTEVFAGISEEIFMSNMISLGLKSNSKTDVNQRIVMLMKHSKVEPLNVLLGKMREEALKVIHLNH